MRVRCAAARPLHHLRAAGLRAVLSSEAGLGQVPPPVEALREFLLMLLAEGFAEQELRRLVRDKPARVFGLAWG
ncbi:MAG: hypothetical protein K5Q68_11175 [Roseococcus sp.]|nr:hypothetical protein [Roseococcus sp.]